jgi:hypothetical protein
VPDEVQIAAGTTTVAIAGRGAIARSCLPIPGTEQTLVMRYSALT